MAMTRRTTLLGIGAVAAGALASRAEAQSPPPGKAIRPTSDEIASIDAAIEELREKEQVPGIGLAIAHHGEIVLERSYGLADAETKAPLTSAHVFRIASITKPITSVAVHTLYEQGKLAPDRRVLGAGGVLGLRFPGPYADPRVTQITVDQLLTHTSSGWPNDHSDPMFRQPKLNQEELIRQTLRSTTLKGAPGTTYAYSNFGYGLLGRVIEAASGKSYAEYVATHVLRPAGITDMAIGGNGLAERRAEEVRYHGETQAYAINVRRTDSHGGWLARPGALVRFLVAVDGRWPQPLLKPETIRAMTTPVRISPTQARGWYVNAAGNWWHLGRLAGVAGVVVRTQSGLAWAALANGNAPKSAVGRELDRAMWRAVRKVAGWNA